MPEWTGAFAGQGLYPHLPEDLYHGDVVPEGSLSVSGAKLLLPPSCPAIFEHRRRHGHKGSRAMDLGTVVHKMILGTGQEIAVLDYADRRTKAYKEDEAKAVADGKLPMLIADYAEAAAIAERVFADEEARRLLDAVTDAELSGFWIDPDTGIWLRMRIDALGWRKRPEIVDVKTTKDSSPESFAKSLAEYRYDMQDRHYRDGLAAILSDWPGELTADDIGFTFIAVQTVEPYLVMVYELGADDAERADESNRVARATYRNCTRRGVWPKWSDSAVTLSLPYYAQRRIDKENSDYYN